MSYTYGRAASVLSSYHSVADESKLSLRVLLILECSSLVITAVVIVGSVRQEHHLIKESREKRKGTHDEQHTQPLSTAAAVLSLLYTRLAVHPSR